MNNVLEIIKKYKNKLIIKHKKTNYMYDKDSDLEKRLDISKYLKFGDFDEIVEEFNYLFEKELNSEYKKNFNDKIKTLKINELKESEQKRYNDRLKGYYRTDLNKIGIDSKDYTDAIEIKERLMHELVHMSSCKSNNKNSGGFEYTIESDKIKLSLGKGLNEGYTELLNTRYFSKKIDSKYYFGLMLLTSGVQKIIGKEVMEKAYFNGKLTDVLKELNKYTGNEDESLNLIYEIDRCADYLSQKDQIEKETKVRNYIAQVIKNKINKELDTGKIDVEEYEKKRFFDVEAYTRFNYIYYDEPRLIDANDEYILKYQNMEKKIDKTKLDIRFNIDEVQNKNTK